MIILRYTMKQDIDSSDERHHAIKNITNLTILSTITVLAFIRRSLATSPDPTTSLTPQMLLKTPARRKPRKRQKKIPTPRDILRSSLEQQLRLEPRPLSLQVTV